MSTILDPHEPGAGWRWRYWSIFSGQTLSVIGSAMTQFVLIWWITDIVGTFGALATAGLMGLLPQALLGPVGGTFADRYSRRMLMILPDAIAAAAFQMPAAAASEAMLVPAHFLPRAVGLNQTMMGIVTIAAAPLGALAIGVMPVGMALWIDVATAALGIVPLLFFRVPQQRMPGERRGIWREFGEGIAVVWRSPRLRRVYALLTVVVLVVMPSAELLPLLVKRHFGGGAPAVAMLEGLGGAGMVAGGAIVALLVPKRLVSWVLWGFTLSCATLAATALVPPNLFWLATVFWTLSGVTFILGDAPFTVLIQTTVPNHLQGRVLALLGTMMGLAAPVGLLAAAPLGEILGVRWLFVLTGGLGTLVCLIALLSPVVCTEQTD